MNVPSLVVVGALRYVVVCDSTTKMRMVDEKEDLGENLGVTNHHKQLILVNPSQGQDQLRVTMIHELLHCIFEGGALADLLDEDDEERVICGLDAALLELMRDNSPLMEWLINA